CTSPTATTPRRSPMPSRAPTRRCGSPDPSPGGAMHLAHTPLYWPTRFFIAELRAENIVQRHREAEERLNAWIAEQEARKLDPWWIKAIGAVLRWIGRCAAPGA